MLLKHLIVHLRRDKEDVYARTALNAEQLRRLLLRERARSDRTGRPFSMILFVSREMDARPNFRPLLRVIKRRVRLTDEFGLLDEHRLAVVLPETDTRGAWKLADDLLAACPTTHEPPLPEVYTYPHDSSDFPDETISDESSGNWPSVGEERPAQPMGALFVRRMPLWKRALDIVGASMGLALASPLLVTSAALIKLTSPGPVIFRQWRAGAGNRPFLIYKLRTMTVDAESRKRELMALNEQDGPAFKIRHDPRVTPVGRILRKTSIDELPQLWNVLKGDMSLVGPRPLPCDESANCQAWQKHRLDVKPGLTCFWQVRGRSRVAFDEWVRMDLQYIRRRRLLTDVLLLAETVLAVLLRRGAC